MICIENISKFNQKEVELKGWIYNSRLSGKLAFLQLRDGTGMIQIVVSEIDVDEKTWEIAQKISMESSVIVNGFVKEDKRAPSGFEIEAKHVQLIHASDEYPISKKEHGPDFLLNNRHLWLRSKRQWAIQRIRSSIFRSIHEFLFEQGYTRFDSPILTPNACEGTTTLFEIDYFDEKAYLSQSGQLYLEAGAMAFQKVFDFGPVFRAEKSKTRRHLMEFWMCDVETAFLEHSQSMEQQEALIKFIAQFVLQKNIQEFNILERDIKPLQNVVDNKFIKKTYNEAVEELQKMGSDIKNGDDFGADDETLLMQKYTVPVFIEKFPSKIKAFYMKRDKNDSALALCNDLLAPEGYGEIVGGSERECDYNELKNRLKEHGLNEEVFSWYLDLRKYGSVPHSGYGLGLERIVAWICGLQHIRETIPFPRMLNRLNP